MKVKQLGYHPKKVDMEASRGATRDSNEWIPPVFFVGFRCCPKERGPIFRFFFFFSFFFCAFVFSVLLFVCFCFFSFVSLFLCKKNVLIFFNIATVRLKPP